MIRNFTEVSRLVSGVLCALVNSRIRVLLCTLFLGLGLSSAAWSNAANTNPGANAPAKLVIVIDDIGYNFHRDRRAAELPGPVTLAVMPFAPHSLRLAEIAQRHGKDVILHQPMQRSRDHHKRAKGLLTQDMSEAEFDSTLADSLSAIPNIIGLNNHAGSLLTTQAEPMQRLMQQLSHRELFFLDSRTTPDTVAYTVAKSMSVPSLSRDVFLDNVRDPSALHRQFLQAIRIARRRGHAVLIAHPYPETLDYLADALYAMPTDVNLQSLGSLMRDRQQPVDQLARAIKVGLPKQNVPSAALTQLSVQ